jgi:hypothetical protein
LIFSLDSSSRAAAIDCSVFSEQDRNLLSFTCKQCN